MSFGLGVSQSSRCASAQRANWSGAEVSILRANEEEMLSIGDRVVPIAGPWAGSPGKVVRVDGQARISVEFDHEPRAPRGVGFYDGRWLRRLGLPVPEHPPRHRRKRDRVEGHD